MSPLQQKFTLWVLRYVLSRPCASRIPRSGRKGEAVNCFVTAIDKGDEPYLIVQTLSDDVIGCIEWDGRSYSKSVEHKLATFRPRDFRITHYYGLSEVRYDGIFDFAVSRGTAWPYAKIRLALALGRFDQYLFNKKKLVAKARNDLLKVLVSEALEGRVEHEPLDLMTSLYSIRWYSHPHGKTVQQKLEFYLESLCETGELKKADYKFVVTGLALRSLEQYEEQERKHTENVKMQWRGFWLALAVALLAVVEAGLIKLPPLLDLTTSKATATR